MVAVQFVRFFSDKTTPGDACDRIEAELNNIRATKSPRLKAYQKLQIAAATAYLEEARMARGHAKRWRSIAEAMFWWSSAYTLSSNTPYGQAAGAAAQTHGFNSRATEAWRIYRSGNPETGRAFGTKEACKRYLLRTKGWSRSACNEYLKDTNSHLANKNGV